MGTITDPRLNNLRSASSCHPALSNGTAPVVFARDFAYADTSPIAIVPKRIESTHISAANAKTFAGYVNLHLSHSADSPAPMNFSAYLGHSAREQSLESEARSLICQPKNTLKDQAENLRKRLLSGPLVDIYLGPEKKHWSLHRKLLCHHSSYFEAELQGHEVPRQNNPKANKLELPNADPVGFELLVKWLYQEQLDDTSQLQSDEEKYEYAVACHKLYLLCEDFDMTRLKNLAMDQYRRCLHEAQLVPDAEELDEIYRASPVGSPFRLLMIRIAARQIMDPDVQRDAEAYRKCFDSDTDFAIEVINAIRAMSGGMLLEDPTQGDFCAYHDHAGVSGCQDEGKGKGKGKIKRQAKAGAVMNGHG